MINTALPIEYPYNRLAFTLHYSNKGLDNVGMPLAYIAFTGLLLAIIGY